MVLWVSHLPKSGFVLTCLLTLLWHAKLSIPVSRRPIPMVPALQTTAFAQNPARYELRPGGAPRAQNAQVWAGYVVVIDESELSDEKKVVLSITRAHF